MKRITTGLCIALSALMFGACGGDEPGSSRPTVQDSDMGQGESDLATPDASEEDTGPSPDGEFTGVMRCEVDDDCDDQRACTTGECVEVEGEGKVCQWTVVESTCLIGGVCHDDGDESTDDPCGVCDPDQSTSEWSAANDGTSCDDGNLCTTDTTCQAGACTGDSVDCDDGNECTVASCDPVQGCVIDPVDDGTSCTDADACTQNSACVAGVCEGEPIDCDDGNECTDNTCDPQLGCQSTNNTEPCSDGDLCTVNSVCSEGVCGGGEPNTCDDFNPCTIDICDPNAGCQHLPTNNPCCSGMTSICDDGDPCTNDLCDPQTAECSYEFNTNPCDDGDACTTNTVCDGAGECAGAPVDCDDGNDCTLNECNSGVGCFATALDGASCDDGLACSTGDICVAGVCEADTSMCFCTPTFVDASKVNQGTLGADETAGEALDVNGDGNLDNTLAPLGSFVNQPLQDAIADGTLMLTFEYIDFAPGPFTLALHTAELDPANAGCDFQAQTCDYFADRASLDSLTCDPIFTIPATRTGTNVTGGGASTSIPLSIPLDANNSLTVTLFMVQVTKTVTLDANGEVVGFSALLGGAITESDLNAAINSLDPASLPLPPQNLISLLATLAPNDIDTNGDGTLNAKSIGLKLDGIDGVMTGAVTP